MRFSRVKQIRAVRESLYSSSDFYASLKVERGRINSISVHNLTKVGQECRTSLIVAIISFRAPRLM